MIGSRCVFAALKNLNFIDSRIGRNSIASVVQAIIVAVSTFIAYRVLIQTVGIEKLGFWSVLLAGAATTRLFDVSGAGGLARFVAECESDNDQLGVVTYVHTVLCTTIVINTLVAGVIYLFSIPIIQHYVESKWIGEARALLPLAIISSIILPAVSSAICSGMDGYQRSDLRAYCNIWAVIVFLLFVFILVPKFGVYGYAVCMLIQHVALIIAGWIGLRSLNPYLGWLPQKLSLNAFKKTISYGLMIQVNSLASFLSEPVAKFMLASYSGLSAVGYYELASRLVFQTKGLFVASMQPIMPAIASFKHDRLSLSLVLNKSTRTALFMGTITFLAIISFSPLYSILMLDKIDYSLLFMLCALALGSSINIFSVPLYFAAMGVGVLKWNILSQFAVAFCIFLAGLLIGESFANTAIIFGIAAGLVIGSVISYFGNLNALGMKIDLRVQTIKLLQLSLALTLFACLIMWAIKHYVL